MFKIEAHQVKCAYINPCRPYWSTRWHCWFRGTLDVAFWGERRTKTLQQC